MRHWLEEALACQSSKLIGLECVLLLWGAGFRLVLLQLRYQGVVWGQKSSSWTIIIIKPLFVLTRATIWEKSFALFLEGAMKDTHSYIGSPAPQFMQFTLTPVDI